LQKKEILSTLESIIKQALNDQNYRVALTALQMLGKEQGLFLSKQKPTLDLELLSDEELEGLLEKYKS
jgi:hypothetical protein